VSKWFERPVLTLLILACVPVFGGGLVWAQDNEQGSEETAGGGESTQGPPERAMISTGLDSDTVASNWPEAAVWLEPPDEERVLALFEAEAITPAEGALLILADEGQSSASGLAGALRQPMVRDGWAVMTLGLEPPPYAVQQARRQTHDGAPEASGEPPADDSETTGGAPVVESESVMIDVIDNVDVDELANQYRTRVQKSLATAVANLTDRGYARVAVAGIGRAAGHVTRMATGADGGDISALIWIAPEFYRDDSVALTEWLSDAGQLRVLELHSARRSMEAVDRGTSTPQQREAAFRRAGLAGYSRQPVAMSPQPQPREAPALANRVSAWLGSDR